MKWNILRRKKIGYSFAVVVVFFAAVEGVSRLVVSDADFLTYVEHRDTIRVLGLPRLNDILEPDHRLFWRLKPEVQNAHVAGEIGDLEIDFTVTIHQGLRSPRVSATKEKFRILALGDSCTFGLGVEDDETWPAQLNARLQQQSVAATVINSGVPGYTAWQGKEFLKSRGLKLKPDLVLVSFGFNDRDTWASRSDIEMAGLRSYDGLESVLMHSRFYVGLKQSIAVEPEKKSYARNRPRLSPQEFFDTLEEINQICRQHKIQCCLVVWPFAGQVANGQHEPLWYQTVMMTASSRLKLPLVNLVPDFISAQEPLFLDHIHANAAGCEVASESIYATLQTLLPESPPQ